VFSRQHRKGRRYGAEKRAEGNMPGLRLACHVMAAAAVVVGLASGAARAQVLIVGNDAKLTIDAGKMTRHAAGNDTLSIIDMSKPDALKMVATVPLDNSIVGSPVNLAITPNREIALVANSVNGVPKDNSFDVVSDTRLFVVDLKANPPAVISTLNLGKRPSGIAINPAGTLALVANRDDGTISVLSIAGKEVKVTDTVSIGAGPDQVTVVAITPDGKRALAAKSGANKIALLSIDGGKVTYDKRDLPVGVFPYNIGVTPNGKLAITADNGAGGASDGNVDTVSVIDLEANPARVIDRIVIGDAPEGFAISPKGDLAVAILLQGSNQPKDSWFYHPGGAVVMLKIDGKKVTKTGEMQVGALSQGVAFSPAGDYLYVASFIGQDIAVLKVDGDKLTDAGRFKLPGHPASMRGGPQ
jgi:DNA-binding beta-propeller fold protein YncE